MKFKTLHEVNYDKDKISNFFKPQKSIYKKLVKNFLITTVYKKKSFLPIKIINYKNNSQSLINN